MSAIAKFLLLSLAALAVPLLPGAPAPPPQAVAAQGRGLEFMTSGQATTPQIPFWAVVAHQELPELDGLAVRCWKNLDDLRATVLAGRGDIWLGHVEGFALAALRGAPVRLVAVTGWRKFSVLTTRPGARDLADLAGPDGRVHLAATPRESPAVAVLEAAGARGGPALCFNRCEPRQLLLDATRGTVRDMVVPEPLTTVLLDKVPGLRVLASVEDIHARTTGGPARLPLAGIAVHRRLAEARPDFVRALVRAMDREARLLEGSPERAAAVLPRDFAAFIDPAVVRRSLARDPLLVCPATDCADEIRDYLALVLPASVAENGASRLPPDFLGP